MRTGFGGGFADRAVVPLQATFKRTSTDQNPVYIITPPRLSASLKQFQGSLQPRSYPLILLSSIVVQAPTTNTVSMANAPVATPARFKMTQN